MYMYMIMDKFKYYSNTNMTSTLILVLFYYSPSKWSICNTYASAYQKEEGTKKYKNLSEKQIL